VLENRLSDPRDEFRDEYKGKYGENERHEEQISRLRAYDWRVLNPDIRLAHVPCASAPPCCYYEYESIEQCSTQIIGVLFLH
jgi:hypothetical protein